MNKKKVLYIISTFDKGVGGHYVSLSNIASELESINEHKIIVIGKVPSPLVNEDLFIKINSFTLIKSFVKGLRYSRKFNPDIIHAFDQHALLLARILNLFLKKKLIMTLCGGPNPYKYFPKTNDLILFSKENYDFFSKLKNPPKNIHLIPNRIKPIEIDFKKISQIKKKYRFNDDNIIILRITRIGSYYEKSIRQTIKLYEELKKNSHEHVLLIIGVIEDANLFEKLKKINSDVIFETSDEYIINANRLINIAQIVVGTGRGFMEACNLNKLLYCPSKSFDVPCLVHEGNFEIAFYHNFSERTDFIKKEFDYTNIDFESLRLFYKDKYDELFSMESIIIKYDNVYNQILTRLQKEYKIDLLIHLLRFIKALIIPAS